MKNFILIILTLFLFSCSSNVKEMTTKELFQKVEACQKNGRQAIPIYNNNTLISIQCK